MKLNRDQARQYAKDNALTTDLADDKMPFPQKTQERQKDIKDLLAELSNVINNNTQAMEGMAQAERVELPLPVYRPKKFSCKVIRDKQGFIESFTLTEILN